MTSRNDSRIELLGLTLEELEKEVKALQLPRFTAKQIAMWMYAKRCADFSKMSDISLKGREILQEKCKISLVTATKVSESADGCKKYLFATSNGFVESVYIPEKDRATLCISSQVGCRMGCRFCATGSMGYSGNLTAGEIINQVLSINECDELTNIVYMGMGEPLDNPDAVFKSMEIMQAKYGLAMSYKRITLSTVGIIPVLKQFLDKSNCHLAVSVHAASDTLRKSIVPAENAYPIKKVIEVLRNYDWSHQRRLSFEYTMLAGINDDKKQASELSRLIKGMDCLVNLIPYHDNGKKEYHASELKKIEDFKNILEEHHINTTVRRSRGQDIEAACGMLSAKQKTRNNA